MENTNNYEKKIIAESDPIMYTTPFDNSSKVFHDLNQRLPKHNFASKSNLKAHDGFNLSKYWEKLNELNQNARNISHPLPNSVDNIFSLISKFNDRSTSSSEENLVSNKEKPAMFFDNCNTKPLLIELNEDDAHLELSFSDENRIACTSVLPGNEWLWRGVRGNLGVFEGKYMYEVQILETICPMEFEDPEKRLVQNQMLKVEKWGCRLGWSTQKCSLFLGQDEESFAYDNNGFKLRTQIPGKYAEGFQVGDTIRCCIDLVNSKTISFFKNGIFLGYCFYIPKFLQNGKTFFPHICLKNCKVQVNFGRTDSGLPIFPLYYQEQNNSHSLSEDFYSNSSGSMIPFSESPELSYFDITEYIFLSHANPAHTEQKMFSPESKQRNLIMMVGIPSSGKSTWVQKEMRNHPENNYYVLGTKNYYQEMMFGNFRLKFLHASINNLMEVSASLFQNALRIASKKNRNIIIDQCNCSPLSRIEKLLLFPEFRKIAICIVNKKFEQTLHWEKTAILTKNNSYFPQITEEGLYNLIENCILPEIGAQEFNEIIYPSLIKEEAQKVF